MRRASELHRMQSADRAPGLTLAELEEVAAESGIPPEFLRSAVRESVLGVETRSLSGQTHTHAFIERVVPGRLSESDWENVVILLRRRYGSDLGMVVGNPLYGQGTLEQFGNMRSWRHTSSLGVTSEFSIRTVDDVQHIRFERRVGMARPRVEGVVYGSVLALVSAAILAAVTRSPAMFAAGFFTALAIFAPATEWLDRRWRGRVHAEMNGVVDEVVRLVSEPSKSESKVAGADSVSLPAGQRDDVASDLSAVLDEDLGIDDRSARNDSQRVRS